MRNRSVVIAGGLVGLLAPVVLAIEIRTFTNLVPPTPLPAGVAPNGGGRAEIRLKPGIRERLKLDIEDVEVIADPTDPEFCNGFYEAVLSAVDPATGQEVEFPLPAFSGLIVACELAGDPQGPTAGELDFTAQLNAGQPGINPAGKTLRIWEVEVVRDPVTGAAVPGPNGEPFIIEERLHVACEGVLN
ncbi:MAG TPA: hypothetical protein VKF62_04565 [Planctomycetota bacterium]|nr:hypothetical protein [Planctomycetota bacterium]